MSNPTMSFRELLDASPSVENELITLTGAILKTNDPNAFVLAMANGRTLTVPISAVVSHKIISESNGLFVLRLEIKREEFSSSISMAGDAQPEFAPGRPPVAPKPLLDGLGSIPFFEFHPWGSLPPYEQTFIHPRPWW
jgi:hypothetical protein